MKQFAYLLFSALLSFGITTVLYLTGYALAINFGQTADAILLLIVFLFLFSSIFIALCDFEDIARGTKP